MQTRLSLAVLGLYVVGAILCLAVSDRAVVSLLEDLRTINLSREAEVGLGTIDFEIENLSREIERLQNSVSILEGRSYPDMQEVKHLQAEHHLNLLRMERVSGAKDGDAGLLSYNTVMTGTVGNLTRFLKELEGKHIVRSDQVVLRPADEDGSTVALTMLLLVRAQ